MPRYCPTCGTAADASATICTDCGAALRFSRLRPGGSVTPPPIWKPGQPPPVVNSPLRETFDSEVLQPLHDALLRNGSERDKRTLIGALLYPAGVYFIWRYTRLRTVWKVLATVWAAILTPAMYTPASFAGGLFLISLVTVPLLWIFYEEPTGVRDTKESPAARAPRVTPRGGHVNVIAIEEAPNAAERRLLLAREFVRIAGAALRPELTKRMTWPSRQHISALRGQAELIQASATDPSVSYLPEPRPDDPLSAVAITGAIQSLEGYLRVLEPAQEKGVVSLGEKRILVRERSRLRAAVESITALVQKPS